MDLIYCVEDDEGIRDLITYAVKSAGFEAEGFESASDFEKRLGERLPSMVLLDIMLPDKDGIAILKDIRNNDTTKNVPVIMITAKGTESDKVKGFEYGADDYVTKPFGASVFALMQSGLFTEIVLIDADKDKADGEAMDISHGIPFASPMKIYAGDYDDVVDAAIVIISAGAGQKPGETRLDLVNKNVAIFKSIIPEIAKRNFAGIMLVVANPVDILTQVAIKLSGLPENRVIGSGTVLDSARLRYKLGEHLSVDSRSVHAFILGEHGDSEVVAWSSANVSGVPLSEMCEMRGHYKHKENTEEIATAVKNSAYEIINKKHATYYGIAMSVKRICEVIMRDEKSILPISHMIHGIYDIDGVSLSMPAIVGANGVESDVPINLNGEEALKLKESADALKKIIEKIEL